MTERLIDPAVRISRIVRMNGDVIVGGVIFKKPIPVAELLNRQQEDVSLQSFQDQSGSLAVASGSDEIAAEYQPQRALRAQSQVHTIYQEPVLDPHDRVSFSSGRVVSVGTLLQDPSVSVSASAVIREAFKMPTSILCSPRVWSKMIGIIYEHNGTVSEKDRIYPFSVVRKELSELHRIPRAQQTDVVLLLQQNKEHLMPLLPRVYITPEEQQMLRLQDSETREQVRQRLRQAGINIFVFNGIGQEESERIADKLLSSQRFWDELANNPSLVKIPDLGKYYRTALYRLQLNWHRDTERAKGRARIAEQIQQDSLHQFFAANPADSPLGKKLLAALSFRQRRIFCVSFFDKKPNNEIAKTIGTTANSVLQSLSIARRILTDLVQKPDTEWDIDPIRLAHAHDMESYAAFLQTLPIQTREYVVSHYEQGLSDQAIADSLRTTLQAAKIRGHRAREAMKKFTQTDNPSSGMDLFGLLIRSDSMTADIKRIGKRNNRRKKNTPILLQ